MKRKGAIDDAYGMLSIGNCWYQRYASVAFMSLILPHCLMKQSLGVTCSQKRQ